MHPNKNCNATYRIQIIELVEIKANLGEIQQNNWDENLSLPLV